ncbi:MAG TPA: LytR C-terminal domain-containing protein [Microthrixaceae bacterium]|nr:LytR C-terminal domain-containing protein [Microthrixaceae bacterium]
MNSTQRPRAPRRPAESDPPAMLGIILVVVAFAFGAILLLKGGGIGFENDAKDVKIETGTKDKAPPSTAPAKTDAPSTSVAPAELQIAVLNGAGKNGFAAAGANFLSVAGYPKVTKGNSATSVPTTAVYFAPGYEADAKAIAKLLSIGDVQPLPATPLGKSATDVPANTAVVVVLGPDVEGIISTDSAAGATGGAGTGTTGTGTTGTGTGTTGTGTGTDAGAGATTDTTG